jgi:hypothetical protein
MLLQTYVAAWVAATLFAIYRIASGKNGRALSSGAYWRFLAQPWKLATFGVATAILSWIGWLGYDPTWDIPETVIMGILTFVTAPYAVATFSRFAKGVDRNPSECLTAIVLTLFSASWSYDAYATLFLVPEYPVRMAMANLGISPIFYLLGGLMWSLEFRDGHIRPAFLEATWPPAKTETAPIRKLAPYVAAVTLFMAAVFGYFLLVASGFLRSF